MTQPLPWATMESKLLTATVMFKIPHNKIRSFILNKHINFTIVIIKNRGGSNYFL